MKKNEYIRKYGEEAWKLFLEEKKQYNRAYYEKNKDKINESRKEKYEDNKERISGYSKKWYNKNKDKQKSYRKKYYECNRDDILKQKQTYYQENKEAICEKNKKYHADNKDTILNKQHTHYRDSKIRRSKTLIHAYQQIDTRTNRGECTLTQQWIIDNIFSSKCIYCGETDWTKLGCDRIDNSKPHTPDNCVCSCGKCNVERNRTDFEEFLKQKRGLFN